MIRIARVTTLAFGCALLNAACAPVGSDFVKPDMPAIEAWPDDYREQFEFSAQDVAQWWRVLDDPALNRLIGLAHENNNDLKVAGLRVLEARALLGIATGNQYPQQQIAFGESTALRLSESNANTAGGADLDYIQHNLGLSASWEIDFWGRRRTSATSSAPRVSCPTCRRSWSSAFPRRC